MATKKNGKPRKSPDSKEDAGSLEEKGSRRRHREEMIDEALEESFPSSDPPSYMPGNDSDWGEEESNPESGAA